jgi:hypothetical protein
MNRMSLALGSIVGIAETGIFQVKITRKKGMKNGQEIFIVKGKCRKSD